MGPLVDYCFSELALQKSNSACWSSTKQNFIISSNVTCYPLANKVAKGYSNATVRPSVTSLDI
jgi:hypothetical protein